MAKLEVKPIGVEGSTQILQDQVVATKAEVVTNRQEARHRTHEKICPSTEEAHIETLMEWDTDSSSKPHLRRTHSSQLLHPCRAVLSEIVLRPAKEAIMVTILMVVLALALITTTTMEVQEAVDTEVLAIQDESRGKLQARNEIRRCNKTRHAIKPTTRAPRKHTSNKCKVLLSRAMVMLQPPQQQELLQLIMQPTMHSTMPSNQELLLHMASKHMQVKIMVLNNSTMRLLSSSSTHQPRDKVPKTSRHIPTITPSSSNTTTTITDSNSSLKVSIQQVSNQQTRSRATRKVKDKRRSETMIHTEGISHARFLLESKLAA